MKASSESLTYQTIGYLFPSSRHRCYLDWKLSDILPKTQLQANSLLDFVVDVIRLFSPPLLSRLNKE